VSLLADALQPHFTPGVITVAGTVSHGMRDIVIDPRRGFTIERDDTGPYLLDFRDPSVVYDAVAADCSRLASASFQSLGALADESAPRPPLAWNMVKLYYAAFYAAHATLRLLGRSCTQLDSQHIERLRRLIDILGVTGPHDIAVGLFQFVPTTAGIVQCFRISRAAGGSHEIFWRAFGEHIDATADKILSSASLPSKDAQRAFLRLKEYTAALHTRSGAGYNWLSAVRNEVQYRQNHGVWFPLRISRRDRSVLGRIRQQWLRDPMEIDLRPSGGGELGPFVATCAFTAALCRALLQRVSERSPVRRRCFLEFGPWAFLNDARIGSAAAR
jgi:hypothetical protein